MKVVHLERKGSTPFISIIKQTDSCSLNRIRIVCWSPVKTFPFEQESFVKCITETNDLENESVRAKEENVWT